MKILVLVKQVPDTWGDRTISESTGLAKRAAGESVIDEVTERAIEAALVAQETLDAEVVAASMGPAQAEDALRKALAMGADSAVHVLDDGLAGADLYRTARVLAAVVQRAGTDLVLAGNESTDGRGGVIPAIVAELLGWPHATFLQSITIAMDQIAGTRVTEIGSFELAAPLPAVASVTEQAPEARFPSFRGLRKAKKKPLETLSLAQLDLADDSDAAASVIISASRRPPRGAGTTIVDEGDAGKRIADYLASIHAI